MPDLSHIVSVNTSAPIRAGKPMTAPYKRDVDQLTRDMDTGEEFQSSMCNLHWDKWWGVFNHPCRLRANKKKRELYFVRSVAWP